MKKIWVAVSLLALTACGQSTEESGGGDASEVLPASSPSVAASSLTKPQLAACLTDWKEVAIQGCVALSGAQMSDDQTLVPTYRQALAELKRRCPSPSRIEWVAEQASREALAGFDSLAATGEPPSVPELCETNVTYRGNSEGYDRRVWDPQGLGVEASQATQSERREAEREAQQVERQGRQDRLEAHWARRGRIVRGELGTWVCQATEDSPLSAIVLDATATRDPMGVVYRGQTYRGEYVGDALGGLARVRNGSNRLEVVIEFAMNDETEETKFFLLNARVSDGHHTSMYCELGEE